MPLFDKKQSHFAKMALELTNKYLSQFGYTVTQIDDRIVCAESQCCRITIVKEWIDISLYVKPLAKDIDERYSELLLGVILNALFPEAKFLAKEVRRDKDVQREIERQLRLLVEYCRPMLECDFSQWPNVIKYVEEERSVLSTTPYES